MTIIVSTLVGMIFGFGLILSGMVNPAIVLSFLDIAGNWNPSLLWVMGGAMSVSAIAFAVAKKRKKSYLGIPIQIPITTQIDHRLLIGSFLFGVGWGIAGICPGPALVLVGSGSANAIVFLIAMMTGMLLFEMKHSQK